MHDATAMLTETVGGSWNKRWLSTLDTRTRPDHVEADGQVVSFGSAFTVGGYPMQHPGDKAAPPKETVNCRCTFLVEPADEPTDMSRRQWLSAAGRLGGPR